MTKKRSIYFGLGLLGLVVLILLILINLDFFYELRSAYRAARRGSDVTTPDLTTSTLVTTAAMGGALSFMATYNLSAEYSRMSYDAKSKYRNIIYLSHVHGDAVQDLRLMCSVIEPDRTLRMLLVKQWLGQLKKDGKLPKKDELLRYIETMYGDSDLAAGRVPEFSDAYDHLGVEGDYATEETGVNYGPILLEWGRMLSNEMKPFHDPKYPLGNVFFSGDKDLIKSKYVEHLRIRGYDIKGEVINVGGHASTFCDPAMRVLIGDKLNPKQSGHDDRARFSESIY